MHVLYISMSFCVLCNCLRGHQDHCSSSKFGGGCRRQHRSPVFRILRPQPGLHLRLDRRLLRHQLLYRLGPLWAAQGKQMNYRCCWNVSIICKSDVDVYSQGHESSGDLLIKNVQVKHAGRYSCTVQTIVDNATAEADVFVKGSYVKYHLAFQLVALCFQCNDKNI